MPGGTHRAGGPLGARLGGGADDADQLLQGRLDLVAPGQRGAQVHPHPGGTRVRPMGLEADAAQELDRRHAAAAARVVAWRARSVPADVAAGVAEGLHRLDPATLDQVARHALHQHPPETAATGVGGDVHLRQQHRVRRDRCRREGRGARQEGLGRVEREPLRDAVHEDHPPARPPVAQHRRDPRVDLVGRVVHTTAAHGVELPEHARAARCGELVEVVEGQPDDLAGHGRLLRTGERDQSRFGPDCAERP